MKQLFFVYSLQSETFPELYYIGFTTDIDQRLSEHNSNKSIHTRKGSPWKLVSYIAFNEKEKALAFEKYLKSSNGRLFSKKHF
jgi:putative endonuclease